jgi:hypothetical protein
MRFTFVILLFCCFGADAQMIIKAHANYRPYAVAAQNLLLDDYPNAAAAYSLRKLDKDYTGSCIRIRRINDNAETDIGFVNNYLDTNAISSFIGTNEARVTVWYDQSGNARNATQSVAANQPYISVTGGIITTMNATAGFIRKGLVINGAIRLINNFSTISQPITTFSLVRYDNASGSAGVIYDSYNNTASVLYNKGTTESPNFKYTLSAGTSLSGTTNMNTNINIISALHNSTSSNIYINGGLDASGNANTNGLNGLSIGNIRGNPSPIVGGYVLGGRIGELIIYGSNQSSNRTGIENNINDYYNIYWNGDFAGLLDSFPSSAAAYSLRNLDKDYLGPLVRVRRSNDNAEQDIFGDYYGNLDTVGLKNFVGANSGFVTTWYDQSGNARNATQTTANDQPRIVNAGVVERQNGKPSIFQAAQFLRWSKLNSTLGQAYCIWRSSATSPSVILIPFGSTDGTGTYYGAMGGSGVTEQNYGTPAYFKNLDSQLASTRTALGNAYMINNIVLSYVNNVGRIAEVRSNYPGLTTNTYIFEYVYYENLTNNRTGISNNINSYYSIY